MFPHGWIVWYLLLSAPLALCSLDIMEDNSRVTCSQGLWDCTMTDGTPFDFNSVKVTGLSPQVKLCCREDKCGLCLLIDMEVDLDKSGEEEEGNSGLTENEGTEETKDNEAETGSVTVCYKTPEVLPTCKKVEFTVNQARPSQQSTAQMSLTITNAMISYGSDVSMNSPNMPEKIKAYVDVPSLKDVCSSDINTYVQECDVPKVSLCINKDNQVELCFPGSNSSDLAVCLQNETDGNCQNWGRKPIPLESVTPCTCVQAWRVDDQMTVRSRSCPFKNNTTLRLNLWKKFILSVAKGYRDNYTMLWWNVSAPCRLEGEVWPCERTPGPTVCAERKGFRQQLRNDQWKQNSKGLWEILGVFAQINLKNHPCVMIKINEMEYARGPFCYNNISRWRWSLFAVAVMLLLSLTLLITFCLRNFIKKSVCSLCHGGPFKPVHKANVLVLSPPDSDGMVSAEVHRLGSLLSSSDISVTVDQWSRKGQLSMGPLPWSHHQLLSMDSQCERVVLVLTPKAVERAQTWSSQDSPVIVLQEESPYSDVFRAALFAIQAFKDQDRASNHFVLVTFDFLWTDSKICHNKLPQILQGLPLFHLPSQTKALLSDLCVGRTQRHSNRGRWTRALSGNKYKNREKSSEPETKLLQF